MRMEYQTTRMWRLLDIEPLTVKKRSQRAHLVQSTVSAWQVLISATRGKDR